MWIDVLDETGRFRRRRGVAEVLRRVAAATGLDAPVDGRAREMTLVLVDDDAMARRNVADRGLAGPTDVLSYPSREPDDRGFPAVPHLGDVIVSLDTARRQARGQRPAWHEVAVLATHGLLHLHGFDHQTAGAWTPFDAAQALAEAEARAIDLAAGARRALREAGA